MRPDFSLNNIIASWHPDRVGSQSSESNIWTLLIGSWGIIEATYTVLQIDADTTQGDLEVSENCRLSDLDAAHLHMHEAVQPSLP